MSDMREVILKQPEQITRSLEVNKNVRVEGKCTELVLAGLGGSGHPGDLLNALRLPRVPLTIHRSYDLPRIYSAAPLVILSSHSGNTEETITAYNAAQREGHSLLVSTSGGMLADFAERDGVPRVTIDFPTHQPRHTLLAAFTGVATALAHSGLAEDIQADLERVATTLPTLTINLEEPSRDLAQKLQNTIPVFTASPTLAFAAQNFKIQVNENAKMPAFWNFFPELNHNEMLGFSGAAQLAKATGTAFHVVMLQDSDDHPRIKARMQVTRELYEEWGIGVSSVDVSGTTLLEKLVSAVMTGLWTTYYLATSYEIDPVPVSGVENFKTRLKEVAGEL